MSALTSSTVVVSTAVDVGDQLPGCRGPAIRRGTDRTAEDAAPVRDQT